MSALSDHPDPDPDRSSPEGPVHGVRGDLGPGREPPDQDHPPDPLWRLFAYPVEWVEAEPTLGGRRQQPRPRHPPLTIQIRQGVVARHDRPLCGGAWAPTSPIQVAEPRKRRDGGPQPEVL